MEQQKAWYNRPISLPLINRIPSSVGKTIVTILFLFKITPIGLVLVWLYAPWPKLVRILVTMAIGLLYVNTLLKA